MSIQTAKFPKSVMFITGGGTNFIGSLLSRGGASAYIEEIVVPYGVASSSQLLGYKPERFACERVARDLAVRAYYRCRELIKDPEQPALGLGVTCKLAVENERADRPHVVYISITTDWHTRTSSYLLKSDRKEEEEISSYLIDAAFYGNDTPKYNRLGRQSEQTRNPNVVDVVCGRKPACVLDAIKNPFLLESPLIFPGSFNPPHHGHAKMAELAHKKTGKQVYFELSIHNTDKPSLDHIDIQYRYYNLQKYADQPWFGGIILSSTPLFIHKAELYIKPTFIVGTDTLTRIVDKKYYTDGDFWNMIFSNDPLFLHFKRKNVEVPVLAKVNGLNIKEVEYEDDGVSSTQLRTKVHS